MQIGKRRVVNRTIEEIILNAIVPLRFLAGRAGKNIGYRAFMLFFIFCVIGLSAIAQQAVNPLIFADVPDISIIRTGDTYYMSSTTMHMSPGLPIMKSRDLVNWRTINYAYDTLANVDELNLTNGKDAYGKGSWASSLRYNNGVYYVTTFAQTTGKTYIFSTTDIEKGNWREVSFKPAYHDHSLFFDDDGRVYMVYGNGKLNIVELNADVSGIKPGGLNQVLIENASAPAGANIGLGAEGSQLFKFNGKYYLFNIAWPRGGMRTVIVHRANNILGPWEGRVALQDRGIAQGGIVNTPGGDWYAYFFRDYGAVGRIPYISPLKWEDGWPVIGNNGVIPDTLPVPKSKERLFGMVASDEFNRKKGDAGLPLVWQWNHNPVKALWSLTERKGFLRLFTGRIDTSFLSARNTLTQRTVGPVCSGSVALDFSAMHNGDVAGLGLLQKNYGFVGVKMEGDNYYVTMKNAQTGVEVKSERLSPNQKIIYLKAECDFTGKIDTARFFYSLNGNSWVPLGQPLKMLYTLPHFMGYRFGLFYYATKTVGGNVDFDYFRVTNKISNTH